jgi:pimeloyl-ACP methyl ester carboxylesterase
MLALDRPETQFVLSGELSIAYQVFGHGDSDFLYVPGIISHLELMWEDDDSRAFLTALAQHFRVIIFDKRGQGMSDRIEGATTLEERIDDLRAVMEAAGSESATLFGLSEGGPVCLLFAATYPKKVERLILFGAMAKFWGSDDYPHRPRIETVLEPFISNWGKGHLVALAGPKVGFEPSQLKALAKFERMACSPSGARKFLIANDLIDVRPILPNVLQDTLVIQRRHDKLVRRGNGRYLADHIPNATYLELPTTSHMPQFEDSAEVLDAMVRFVRVSRLGQSEVVEDKKLTTALFTDIVGSTEKLIQMGDQGWRKALDNHDAVATALVKQFRGRIVKNTGDGLLAVFDGPVRALQCAMSLVQALEAIGLPIRAGLHVGEVVNRGEDVTGIAVNIAARGMDKAGAGEVLMTRTLRDLTGGSDMAFASRGEYELKGLSEQFELFSPKASE